MMHERLVKAMEKAGHKVAVKEYSNGLFQVHGPKYVVEWYRQDESAVCVTVRRPNDVSDSMVDYHAGFFVRTIKAALEYANEVSK